MEFKAWPKIIRVENRRTPVFTEKIDGTNACAVWSYDPPDDNTLVTGYSPIEVDGEIKYLSMWAQSRSRFITPENDNYGFANWAKNCAAELVTLGEGYHYGEWWGNGIQRGYGLEEKRFSLFNTRRWGTHNPNTPNCCHVVPILPVKSIMEAVQFLSENGSVAAPGWNRPEGAVMYDPDADTNFKIIIDK